MINGPVGGAIEAELKTPNALVQLVRYHFAEPPDSEVRVDGKPIISVGGSRKPDYSRRLGARLQNDGESRRAKPGTNTV
jgi:hypothetical protein